MHPLASRATDRAIMAWLTTRVFEKGPDVLPVEVHGRTCDTMAGLLTVLLQSNYTAPVKNRQVISDHLVAFISV